jgi:hypothetical protein
MALTRSFKELVESQIASDPAFAEALRREGESSMRPARAALLAFAKAWTYPVRGTEGVPVANGLFGVTPQNGQDSTTSRARSGTLGTSVNRL